MGEQSHNLTVMDPRIVSARNIGKLWGSFKRFVKSNISHNEMSVIVTNQDACNGMKWLWQFTWVHDAPTEIPACLLYYMDPY